MKRPWTPKWASTISVRSISPLHNLFLTITIQNPYQTKFYKIYQYLRNNATNPPFQPRACEIRDTPKLKRLKLCASFCNRNEVKISQRPHIYNCERGTFSCVHTTGVDGAGGECSEIIIKRLTKCRVWIER